MTIKKNVADGAIMKNIREKKGISVHDMAKRLKLPHGDNELFEYENCYKTPSFELVVRFCHINEIQPREFYYYMPDELYDFGARLRQFRMKSKITQKKLASMTRTGQGVISRYERGASDPKIKFVKDAAQALKLEPDELYYLIKGRLPPAAKAMK